MNAEHGEQHLFIIHASDDLDQARRLSRVIQRLPDVQVTLSGHVGVTAGAELVDVLKSHIHAASAVLFLLTPSALDSDWAMLELGMARGMDKPVRILQGGSVPLRIPINVGPDDAFDARKLEDPEVVQDLLSTLPAQA